MDEEWKAFTRYYFNDFSENKVDIFDIKSNKRVWIVKNLKDSA
jgi:hypothetical protein